MSDEEITVIKATGYTFTTAEAIADGNALRAGLNKLFAQATDPNYVPPKPIEPPGPDANPLYVRLCAAADGLAAELLALHKPKATVYPKADGMAPHVHWSCEGDEYWGAEAEPPDWPCETTAVIARHLGVEVSE